MPSYEYRCNESHVSTRLRAISARRDPVKCDECQKNAELVFSAPASPVLNPARPVKPLGKHHQ